jgi:hypothetical protein
MPWKETCFMDERIRLIALVNEGQMSVSGVTTASVSETEGSVSVTTASVSETEGSVSVTTASVSETEGSVSVTTASVNETEGSVSVTTASVNETEGSVSVTTASVRETKRSLRLTTAVDSASNAIESGPEGASAPWQLRRRLNRAGYRVTRFCPRYCRRTAPSQSERG